MIDPHVERLNYKVIFIETVDFDTAPPIISEKKESFTLNLNGNAAIFEMSKHFPTVPEAKAVVDDFLKRWEVLIGIESQPDELKFVFEKADIIDRRQNATIAPWIPAICGVSSVTGELHLSRPNYPERPDNFSLSPDVETMYVRYKAYKEKRETLCSMAYMCLTILEASAERGNKRKSAAKKYRINEKVLAKLGELCSKRGNKEEARKAPSGQQFQPLTGKEKYWIEEAVKAFIRRAGECAHDPEAGFREITMADLPAVS